ncbi:hypothetical protein BELL_0579g00060 [Botrytis elliptica]|uniref:Uncharacterized protein n=1 Tax=Botrytis elliptica TaxID=278938 RepID=A0A4Z1JCK2_9HELO|nr:hypothetical protein BELL_0579g00060 [Botrytis elliptica]
MLRENIDWQTAVNLHEYLDRDNSAAFDYGTGLCPRWLEPFRHAYMFGGCYERAETTRSSPPFKNFVACLEENKDGNWEQY